MSKQCTAAKQLQTHILLRLWWGLEGSGRVSSGIVGWRWGCLANKKMNFEPHILVQCTLKPPFRTWIEPLCFRNYAIIRHSVAPSTVPSQGKPHTPLKKFLVGSVRIWSETHLWVPKTSSWILLDAIGSGRHRCLPGIANVKNKKKRSLCDALHRVGELSQVAAK